MINCCVAWIQDTPATAGGCCRVSFSHYDRTYRTSSNAHLRYSASRFQHKPASVCYIRESMLSIDRCMSRQWKIAEADFYWGSILGLWTSLRLWVSSLEHPTVTISYRQTHTERSKMIVKDNYHEFELLMKYFWISCLAHSSKFVPTTVFRSDSLDFCSSLTQAIISEVFRTIDGVSIVRNPTLIKLLWQSFKWPNYYNVWFVGILIELILLFLR